MNLAPPNTACTRRRAAALRGAGDADRSAVEAGAQIVEAGELAAMLQGLIQSIDRVAEPGSEYIVDDSQLAASD